MREVVVGRGAGLKGGLYDGEGLMNWRCGL